MNRPAIETRTAGPDDVGGVLASDPGVSAGDEVRRTMVHTAVAEGHCLVAVADGRVAGFVVTTPGRFFDRDFIDLLMVSTAARRRGVGRSLLRAAVAGASAGRDLWTSTNRSNGAMRALLESERWQFCGELVGLDDDDPELFFRTRRASRDLDP